jgi:hypothetical protein
MSARLERCIQELAPTHLGIPAGDVFVWVVVVMKKGETRALEGVVGTAK